MKLTEEQYELIEAYLGNELSATDRASVEADMAADAEFRAEVDYQRSVRTGLQMLGIEQAVNRAKAQYVAGQAANASPTLVRPLGQPDRSRWQYWAAAASVVLLLGVGYGAYQYNSRQSYTSSLLSAQSDDLLKEFPREGLSASARDQLVTALEAYRAGEYDKVIENVKALPENRQTVYYKDYLLGLSYLANREPVQAIPLLQSALATPSPVLRQKAEWILALAYVKNGQNEKALPILTRVSTNKANPYRKQAQQVLQKIK